MDFIFTDFMIVYGFNMLFTLELEILDEFLRFSSSWFILLFRISSSKNRLFWMNQNGNSPEELRNRIFLSVTYINDICTSHMWRIYSLRTHSFWWWCDISIEDYIILACKLSINKQTFHVMMTTLEIFMIK